LLKLPQLLKHKCQTQRNRCVVSVQQQLVLQEAPSLLQFVALKESQRYQVVGHAKVGRDQQHLLKRFYRVVGITQLALNQPCHENQVCVCCLLL
jgi:hypothetical protein